MIGDQGLKLHPLNPMAQPGIYVVQFPYAVKVGQTGSLTQRWWQHRQDGADGSFIGYKVRGDYRHVERPVLEAVRRSGAWAIRGVEFFAGRTFEQIAWTVEHALYALEGTVEVAGYVTVPTDERIAS